MNNKILNEVKSLLSDKLSIDNLPVEVVDIAKNLNIEVYDIDFPFDNVLAALHKKDGRLSIYVNESLSLEQKRFAIAHEIGHYRLHELESDIYFKDRINKNEKNEVEADDFAAELLMVEDLFKFSYKEAVSLINDEKYFNVSMEKKDSILTQNLAKLFGVTEGKVKFRIEKLGLLNM